MASINFITKSRRKGTLATVYLRLKNGRDCDITLPTRFKVLPEYWLNTSQKFKKQINFTEHFSKEDVIAFENRLIDLKNFICKELNIANMQIITKEWLKQIMRKYDDPVLFEKEKLSLNQFFDLFLDEIKSGKRLNSKKERYNPFTIKNIKGFVICFREFQKSQNREYDFRDINLEFYNNFVNFLVWKNYRPNTIGRFTKQLKTLMNYAEVDGLHSNMETKKRAFKNLSCDVEAVYLTENEIKRIYKLDLSENKSLCEARDIFLVGCYTAQRFSDYSKIKKENVRFIDDKYVVIELTQQKTGEKVIIPTRPELITILERYDYNLPKTYEQKVNERIKKVAELAGIKEMVELNEIVGGIKRKTVLPKHKLIKTHTARRSGCTNMYLAGISTLDIMRISGHKTEREFLKYIKITKEQTAINLFNHPYFNNVTVPSRKKSSAKIS